MAALLIFHITAALAGVGLSTYTFLSPSRYKLRAAYGLVALTLASGTCLVILTHVSILSGCISGLVYVSIVLAALAPARHKLVKNAQQID